jgi:hypothetical protein
MRAYFRLILGWVEAAGAVWVMVLAAFSPFIWLVLQPFRLSSILCFQLFGFPAL